MRLRARDGEAVAFSKTDLQASRKNFVLRLNTANLLRKPKIHTLRKTFGDGCGANTPINYCLAHCVRTAPIAKSFAERMNFGFAKQICGV